MVNIPGAIGVLPGIYGPIIYPIKKIDDGFYYIKGYTTTEFKGTPKEIAKQIFLKLVNEPEQGSRKNFVGPFAIDFKPMRCYFVMNANPDPPELDYKALAIEISKELEKLEVLLPFS